MTIRISATAHEYGGKNYAAGDEIDVEPGDVALLVALRRIERTEDDPIPGYMTREMLANQTSISQPAPKARLGKYQRKAA